MDTLFESIASDIESKGYSIQKEALPPQLLGEIRDYFLGLPQTSFKQAGVGRNHEHTVKNSIRTDKIFWIDGKATAEQAWLHWANSLKSTLNRRLFLGLKSFESHFASYATGAFYSKHQDAFKGDANRVLSIVAYLNENWQPEDGGELVIYPTSSETSLKVTPQFGTLVVFLSEEILHEVLPAKRDRFSIAGWFRVKP